MKPQKMSGTQPGYKSSLVSSPCHSPLTPHTPDVLLSPSPPAAPADPDLCQGCRGEEADDGPGHEAAGWHRQHLHWPDDAQVDTQCYNLLDFLKTANICGREQKSWRQQWKFPAWSDSKGGTGMLSMIQMAAFCNLSIIGERECYNCRRQPCELLNISKTSIFLPDHVRNF